MGMIVKAISQKSRKTEYSFTQIHLQKCGKNRLEIIKNKCWNAVQERVWGEGSGFWNDRFPQVLFRKVSREAVCLLYQTRKWEAIVRPGKQSKWQQSLVMASSRQRQTIASFFIQQAAASASNKTFTFFHMASNR
jgi:hypothetical protein